MKREIKFRGKIIETCYDKCIDEWVIGNYIFDAENDVHIIQPQNLNCQFYVDGDTVGQFTGLKDRNGKGKEIYEGDIDSDGFKIIYYLNRFVFANSENEPEGNLTSDCEIISKVASV